jgi:phosphoribosylformylglycinamidine synthase
VTLTLNDSGRYEDRWVHLAVDSHRCVMLRGIDAMYLPVAHAEGKFVVRDQAILDQLRNNHQIALAYRAPPHTPVSDSVPYPANPNGSIGNVAGLCDETGRVLGLMPHPERYVHRTQHPRWTREELPEEGEGLRLFRNAVGFFS